MYSGVGADCLRCIAYNVNHSVYSVSYQGGTKEVVGVGVRVQSHEETGNQSGERFLNGFDEKWDARLFIHEFWQQNSR